ncbi:MAG: T9SS type A sorting domain-containing protein [Bacteroidetes bacterium]|nr:T9SS type A sorting domain-containing protein [Bacteroidota bacterium]
MKKLLPLLCLALLLPLFSFAQFISYSAQFQPTGIANSGLVVGYDAQAGPYKIWNPDSNTVVSINGLAPGMGIGSQAHFSDSGAFISGTSYGIKGAEMSRYNVASNQWTPIGSLGFTVDSTVSGGFGISGNGNTVVGLTWADTAGGAAYAHAAAWDQTEGFIDLGSLHDSIKRSTRANAASFDGSVIVGWQDYNGPWKSAVWRKNPLGGYYQNEYLLIDTSLSNMDEFNQLGECSVVSADGNWIGGYGDYANGGQPWMWSQATGVINLGTLPNGSTGYVSGINDDGSLVVGWFDGMFFGDPQIPFIWTAASGLQDLNVYISSTLGLNIAPNWVNAATGLSSNGNYIIGYGLDTSNFSSFIYRLATPLTLNVKNITTEEKVSIYPNPFQAATNIQFTKPEWHEVKVLNLLGEVMKVIESSSANLVLEKEELKSGVYFLQITNAAQAVVVKKIIVH